MQPLNSFFFAHESDFASSGDNSPLVAFTETWKNFPARWFPQNAGLLCPEQIEGGAVCRCGVFYRTLTRCMLRPCGAWIYSSSHSVVWTLWLASLSSMLPHSSRRLLYSCWHFCVFAGEGFTYLHIVSVEPCVLKIENENLWGCWPSNLAWHSFTRLAEMILIAVLLCDLLLYQTHCVCAISDILILMLILILIKKISWPLKLHRLPTVQSVQLRKHWLLWPIPQG